MRRPALAVLAVAALALAGCSNEPVIEEASTTPAVRPAEPVVVMTAEESFLAGLDDRGVSSTLSREQTTRIGQAVCVFMPMMSREELIETIATESTQGNRETSVALVESAGAHLCPSARSQTEPPAPAPAPAPAPELTAGQENAVRKAESYLDYTAFSRSGLIDQLEYEGFSTDDATFAVDTVTVDWMVQAAKKAQNYLEYTSFSRSGLIDQLEYEGFTPDEAVHGADSTGL